MRSSACIGYRRSEARQRLGEGHPAPGGHRFLALTSVALRAPSVSAKNRVLHMYSELHFMLQDDCPQSYIFKLRDRAP